MTNHQPGRLSSLPVDLQNQVFTFLEYPPAVILAATNRHFMQMAGPVTLTLADQRLAQYAESFYSDGLSWSGT